MIQSAYDDGYLWFDRRTEFFTAFLKSGGQDTFGHSYSIFVCTSNIILS